MPAYPLTHARTHTRTRARATTRHTALHRATLRHTAPHRAAPRHNAHHQGFACVLMLSFEFSYNLWRFSGTGDEDEGYRDR